MAFSGPCQIRRALIMDSGLAQLDLKGNNGEFDWNWFVSSSANAKQALAVGIAAIATNKLVYADIADPTKSYSVVTNFGIIGVG